MSKICEHHALERWKIQYYYYIKAVKGSCTFQVKWIFSLVILRNMNTYDIVACNMLLEPLFYPLPQSVQFILFIY